MCTIYYIDVDFRSNVHFKMHSAGHCCYGCVRSQCKTQCYAYIFQNLFLRLYNIMRAMCRYISKKPILYVDRISESKHVERSSGKKGRSPSRVEKSSSYRSTRRMYPDYYLHFTSNVYCILMSGKSKALYYVF